MLMFEDFRPGHFMTLGPRRVTREEIIAFAAEFDPQPMHLDDEAASRSLLGSLSGSGWHMCALAMRMMADGFLTKSSSRTGLGVPEVRWLAPLRPDDDVSIDLNITETRTSKSRPDAGIVAFHLDMFNAKRVKLMTMDTAVMFGCRERVS